MLRKKPPYTCRHTTAGKLDHYAYALADSDGELCPAHQAEQEAAKKAFFEKPIYTTPAPVVAVKIRRIWP